MTVFKAAGRDVELLDEYADEIAEATHLGYVAAENAASWATDGNTDRYHARITLKMLRDGDPEAWDHLPPVPDLSGVWADGLTPTRLYNEVMGDGGPDDPWEVDSLQEILANAWEDAVGERYEQACEKELVRFIG